MEQSVQISEEIRKALDQFDWHAIEVPRSAVESNPKVAEQLCSGKATDLITYNVQIPGIPEPMEKTVQLFSRRVKDEESGAWVLDPKLGVREMDADYKLTKDNLTLVLESGKTYRFDPEKDKEYIDAMLERRTVVNKETGEQFKQFVCNICPKPFIVTYKDGREQSFFLGFDSRSLRPVAISENALKARFVDEQGHSKISYELFGKGIKVDDCMAQALSEGKISAAFGKGVKTGEPFATAISFNVARGEITEDHSAKGQEIRSTAYDYLRKTTPKEDKGHTEQKAPAKKEAPAKKVAPKL